MIIKPFRILALLFFCTLLNSADAASDTPTLYLLLNDNRIIQGEVIVLDQGYLYFKNQQRILKISPADFKGIFSSKSGAENAIIILDELPDSDAPDQIEETYNFIHNAAEDILASPPPTQTITAILDKLEQELVEPARILDITIYKRLLLLCAVAQNYHLRPRVEELISDCTARVATTELENNKRERIMTKLKTAAFLLAHPYDKEK